jgi:hypothetical protein
MKSNSLNEDKVMPWSNSLGLSHPIEFVPYLPISFWQLVLQRALRPSQVLQVWLLQAQVSPLAPVELSKQRAGRAAP